MPIKKILFLFSLFFLLINTNCLAGSEEDWVKRLLYNYFSIYDMCQYIPPSRNWILLGGTGIATWNCGFFILQYPISADWHCEKRVKLDGGYEAFKRGGLDYCTKGRPSLFRIEGRIKNDLSRSFMGYVSSRGLKINPGIDLTGPLVRYMIMRIGEDRWAKISSLIDKHYLNIKQWRRIYLYTGLFDENRYGERVLLVTIALHRAIMTADIQLLNELFEDFTKDVLLKKR